MVAKMRMVMYRAILTGSCCFLTAAGWAQPVKPPAATPPLVVEQPDANRTREELSRLLEHYPPNIRTVLALDPSLLGNQAFLEPYPALTSFLSTHPDVPRSPEYYVAGDLRRLNMFRPQDTSTVSERVWSRVFDGVSIFCGLGLAVGLLTWLIRTTIDYRRWNRLTKIQTDVHTKILDRFTGSEELLAYIKSPAGGKFLESTPIALDAGPRNINAPLGRILWSVQAGLVLAAGGAGLETVSGRITDEAGQPITVIGILAIALGVGFLASAIVSWVISNRLGLIEPASRAVRAEPPVTLG